MNQSLEGPRAGPAHGGAPDALIVLLHGYGADGDDLIGLAPHLAPAVPGAAFVAPNAPKRCAMGFGYEWFPIVRLDPAELARGVAAAAPALVSFLEAELARWSLPPERLALVGFSQGTMMALHVGLRLSPGPCAIVGYSGALAAPERLTEEIASRPPVLLIHGASDDVVPVTALHTAVEALGAAGVAVRFHVAPGLGHQIDGQGVALAAQFLREALQPKALEPQ